MSDIAAAVSAGRGEARERRAPDIERRGGRRYLVADLEVDSDVAQGPLGEALGEALLAAGARAEQTLLAAQAGRDAGVQGGGDVVGEQRVIDHVPELVQDRALHATRAVTREDE